MDRPAGKAAGRERPGSEAAPVPGPWGGAGSALGLPHPRRGAENKGAFFFPFMR